MKRVSLILITALLAGCASTISSPVRLDSGEVWQVDGEYNNMGGTLKVAINNEEVINQRLGWSGGEARARGTYQDNIITSTCIQQYAGPYDVWLRCDIYREEEQIAEYIFQ